MYLRFLKVSLFLIAAIELNAAEPQISDSGQAYDAYRDEPTAGEGACNIRSCAVKKCSGECACFEGFCTVTNEHTCDLADGDFFPGLGCWDVCARLPTGDCRNEPVPFCWSARVWELILLIAELILRIVVSAVFNLPWIVVLVAASLLVAKEVSGWFEPSAKAPPIPSGRGTRRRVAR